MRFFVAPPPISERALLMSLAMWKLRRDTHLSLQRCECSSSCLRGDQYIGIAIKEISMSYTIHHTGSRQLHTILEFRSRDEAYQYAMKVLGRRSFDIWKDGVFDMGYGGG